MTLDKILRRLEKALAHTQLPTKHGGPREATVSEFMWVRSLGGNEHFKHHASRNHLVLRKDGTLYIPAIGEAFYQGTFDPSPPNTTPYYPSA